MRRNGTRELKIEEGNDRGEGIGEPLGEEVKEWRD